ncbi:MAG TPA: BPSS1780 family membrane protein [Burkholderiales bacterium]|nr:BPSS1780 family membrane protein [Burkholderiales bacterium]
MSTDPYAAPKAHVADVPASSDARFIPEGQAVAASHGWTWIAAARAMTKPQTLLWIGVFVVFAIIVVALGRIPVLGMFLMYFIPPILFGGVMMGCEAVRNGGKMTFGHLFAGFQSHTRKLLGIGLFTFGAIIAILLVVGAIFGMTVANLFLGGRPDAAAMDPTLMGMNILLAVLIMLALSIPVYMAVWFSYPLVVINDLPVTQALKVSFYACVKNVVPFLLYGVIAFLLAIVATIPLALGWLILGPVMLVSLYTAYRDIFYAA